MTRGLGQGAHRIRSLDVNARSATCVICGPTRVRPKKTKSGMYRFRCVNALRPWRKNADYTYRRFKGERCERCGFVAEHPCQLDVNHRNGNHSDHSTENLETLCANCHRLLTELAGHSIRMPVANATKAISPELLLLPRNRIRRSNVCPVDVVPEVIVSPRSVTT